MLIVTFNFGDSVESTVLLREDEENLSRIQNQIKRFYEDPKSRFPKTLLEYDFQGYIWINNNMNMIFNPDNIVKGGFLAGDLAITAILNLNCEKQS